MTSDELKAKISELEATVDSLDEPERTFAKADIRKLRIEIAGKSLDAIARIAAAISTASLQKMDEEILAAKDATKKQERRVDAFNAAYGLVKKAFDLIG